VLTRPHSLLQLLLIHGIDDKVTSYKATQSFYDKVVADDKKLCLYEVPFLSLSHACPSPLVSSIFLTLRRLLSQGAYHEIQNEPDGVKEKMTEECITWIEAHLSGVSSAPITANASAEAATPVSKL
jgi:acylglycerol lipase